MAAVFGNMSNSDATQLQKEAPLITMRRY